MNPCVIILKLQIKELLRYLSLPVLTDSGQNIVTLHGTVSS